MPETFLAKDYNTRADLEKAIEVKVGKGIIENKKENHIISGTTAELKALNLKGGRSVFGCTAIPTDIDFEKSLKTKKYKKNER